MVPFNQQCLLTLLYHLFGRIFFNFDYVIKVLLITETSLFAWLGTYIGLALGSVI